MHATDAKTQKIKPDPIFFYEGRKVSEAVCKLGVVIDDQLSFTDHIATTARSCRFALYNIRKIRPFLSEQAAQLLVQALVLSRLDYCNALGGPSRIYYQASATDPECSSQSGL